MTRRDLLEELLAERYSGPVREWRCARYGLPTDYAEVVRRRAEAAEVADLDDNEDEEVAG